MRIYLSIPFGSYLYLLHLLEVGILDVVVSILTAPDFVIASPKNPHQRV